MDALTQRHAPDQGVMTADEFRQGLHAQLLGTGVLGTVKSQLRTQLIAQLKNGRMLDVEPAAVGGQGFSLKQRALHSMLAEYLGAAQLPFSLSIFSEESGTGSAASMSDAEVLSVLRVDPGSTLHAAFKKARATLAGTRGASMLLALMDALADVGSSGRALDSATQTAGPDRFNLEARMQQLDRDLEQRLQSNRLHGPQGVEERMALFRQQMEEQSRADVARQVERVREVEVAAARLEEGAKWRKALESERAALERLHSERLSKLRLREDELTEKLKRQQREVESLAFDHRQRLQREEERLRGWRQEAQSALDGREEQLKHLARALELREKAVTSRESAAEARVAEAAQAVGNAHVQARAEVEREYLELKATLSAQRMQLEMDRARVMELRSEAAALSAAAAGKEDRLRTLEAARAEAEARAAGHAAEAEVVRLQVERLQLELANARDQLEARAAQAAGSTDMTLVTAAGALGMLEKETAASRTTGAQVRALQRELAATQQQAAAAQALAEELDGARAAAEDQVRQIAAQWRQMEELVEQALGARDSARRAADDAEFTVSLLQRQLADSQAALARAREELASLRPMTTGHPGARATTPFTGTTVGRGATPMLSTRPPSSYATGVIPPPVTSSRGRVRSPPRGAPVPGPYPLPAPLGSPSKPSAAEALFQTASPARAKGDAATLSSSSSSTPSKDVPQLPPGMVEKPKPRSPIRERLERLSREEAGLAAEMASMRLRVSEQRKTSERELQAVMARAAFATTTSSPRATPPFQGGVGASLAARAGSPPVGVPTAPSPAYHAFMAAAEAQIASHPPAPPPASHAPGYPVQDTVLRPAPAAPSPSGTPTAPENAAPPVAVTPNDAAPTGVSEMAGGGDGGVHTQVAGLPNRQGASASLSFSDIRGGYAAKPEAGPSAAAAQPAPLPPWLQDDDAPPAPAPATAGGSAPSAPPGLVLVSSFAPAADVEPQGGTQAAENMTTTVEAPQTFLPPQSLDDVRTAQAARLRLLEEQQAQRLRAVATSAGASEPRGGVQEGQGRGSGSGGGSGRGGGHADDLDLGRSAAQDEDEEEQEEEYDDVFDSPGPTLRMQAQERERRSPTSSTGSSGSGVLTLARAVLQSHHTAASPSLRDHAAALDVQDVDDGDDESLEQLPLETADDAQASSQPLLLPVDEDSSDGSIPSHLAALGLVEPEDSSPELEVAEDSSSVALGGIGGSSGSVF